MKNTQKSRKFRRISKEVEILTSDSGQDTRTAHGYLPGGTLSVLLGQAAGLKMKSYTKTDTKGR